MEPIRFIDVANATIPQSEQRRYTAYLFVDGHICYRFPFYASSVSDANVKLGHLLQLFDACESCSFLAVTD